MVKIKNLTSVKSSFKRKAGQLPGTLLYTGEASDKVPKVFLTQYDDKELKQKEVQSPADLDNPDLLEDNKVNWLHIKNLNHGELLSKVSTRLDIHTLLLEDALNIAHPPKIEESGLITFFTIKDIRFADNHLKSAHVSLFLGTNFVLSMEEGEGKFARVLIERLEKKQGRLRMKQNDYLFYSIIDFIIDQYFLVVDVFRDSVEELEEQLIKEPDKDYIQDILALKKHLMFFRRYLFGLNKEISTAFNEEYGFLTEKNTMYFKDASEHVSHVLDATEHLRDLVVNLVELNNNNQNNKMNSIMKTLTLVAAIFIPLTFLAGIYGMNFEYIPELSWKYSYFVLLGLMAVITVVLLWLMRRKGWFN
ncbi:MAG TPA: magnesium/cobalt transporter CorA [Bacteroidales bacterium]|nr:magnesium/cobalt transporter CorA [Bacteroidales bacterium]